MHKLDLKATVKHTSYINLSWAYASIKKCVLQTKDQLTTKPIEAGKLIYSSQRNQNNILTPANVFGPFGKALSAIKLQVTDLDFTWFVLLR